jgi:hypothetical protein
MATKVMKWLAIAALIGTSFSRSLPGLGVALLFAITIAAIIVLTQAAATGRYVWTGLFLVTACVFGSCAV